jgi:hypothetical protein
MRCKQASERRTRPPPYELFFSKQITNAHKHTKGYFYTHQFRKKGNKKEAKIEPNAIRTRDENVIMQSHPAKRVR